MLLANEGYTVLEADSPLQLASIVARHKPGLVLLDMNFSRDTTSGKEGRKSCHNWYNKKSAPLMTARATLSWRLVAYKPGLLILWKNPG